VGKDNNLQKIYDAGIKLSELMQINVLGYQTHRDKFAVDANLKKLTNRINDFVNTNIDENELKRNYDINESKDWVLKNKREELKIEKELIDYISLTSYRPFDNQYAILNKAICDRPRKEILQHVLNKDNLCLLNSKQQAIEGFRHCFISKLPANDCVMSTTSREANQVFPLYLYPETNGQLTTDATAERVPNLNLDIVNKIAKGLGLAFVAEKEGNSVSSFAPIDLLDYTYAVLHSPTYREKYKEFLKIDFPKIPYPKDTKTFWDLVALGAQIRQIHLLESATVEDYFTEFNIDGDCVVGKTHFEKTSDTHGNVYLNFDKTPPSGAGGLQYFANVPLTAWSFYIGGYQPAQKWLKDRKGRKLEFDDILHYQKIIVALTETDRLMKAIDLIAIE
jgi:predicted helicase